MPTTEAGKRLLDEWADDHERVQLEPMVDAIEAEARADANSRLSAAHQAGIEVGRDEERARIRAAVEGLPILGYEVDVRDVLAIIDKESE